MEIKIDIDDARIVREVLSGRNMQEIEDQVIKEIKKRIIDDIFYSLNKKIVSLREDLLSTYTNKVLEDFKKEAEHQIKNKITPKEIKEMFKGDGKWVDWIDDVVGNLVANHLEDALSNWLSMELIISSKKGGTKRVELMAAKE